jgi:hypothetical protein
MSGNKLAEMAGQRQYHIVNSANSGLLNHVIDGVDGITTTLSRLDLDMSVMQEARADIQRLSTEVQDMRADIQRMSTEIINLQINQAAERQVSAASAAGACDI